MELQHVLEGIEIEKSNVDLTQDITSVCYSSRDCIPGSVFVCIKGFQTDGHKYIGDALKRGAVCVVASDVQPEDVPCVLVKDTRKALALMGCNWFQHPSKKFQLIGITGTNGKTSTTYMIKSILEEGGRKVGLIGTNHNMIGDKVLPTDRTTPESFELQKLFAEMVEEGVDTVVMEVSSHSLALDRVYGCAFDVGVFTNLTQDHLDFHKTMEAYLEAKAKLFTMCTVGIINRDDPAADALLKASTAQNFTYGMERNDCSVMAKNVRMTAKGVEFELLHDDAIDRIRMNIPGRFTVYNALAAITTCLTLGVPSEQIKQGLWKIQGVKGRIEVVPTVTPYTVIIDYAHTPDGLVNVINSVKDFAKGRVITLFGCGGDRDRTKRPIMGKVASDLSDFCIVTSDNPRSEDPQAIVNDILEGMKDAKCGYDVVVNRKEAIAHALRIAQPDDIIILAGKGHETYQILKEGTIHFDEREVVAECLQEQNKM